MTNHSIAPNFNLDVLCTITISLALSIILLHLIRSLSLSLNVFDVPEERSSHQKSIPTLGGIAFFIILLITTQFFGSRDVNLTIISALLVILFTGLFDDLKNLAPKFKLLGQFLAAGILVLNKDFRLISVHGFLGLPPQSEVILIATSILIVLTIVNAFNLIDGIDGMAAIIGIIIFSNLGVLFYSLNLTLYFFMSLASISMLIGYLRFNFSTKKKIFMGDTGSLILGLVLSFMTLRVLALDSNKFQSIKINSFEIPILLVAIFFIPLLDIIRVITIRLLAKKRFYTPDRNHIHHVLIDSGLSHKAASICIGIFNLFVVIIIYTSLVLTNIYIAISILMLLSLSSILILSRIKNRRETKRGVIK
jgi:UDP-GlcNAc:undecaprenyl-phosphate/decaprenyl-phosphate GlcNAc-1-phosphate transferase